MQCKNVDDFEIDYQLIKTGCYLAQKIYDLKRAPLNKKMKTRNEKIKINTLKKLNQNWVNIEHACISIIYFIKFIFK